MNLKMLQCKVLLLTLFYEETWQTEDISLKF